MIDSEKNRDSQSGETIFSEKFPAKLVQLNLKRPGLESDEELRSSFSDDHFSANTTDQKLAETQNSGEGVLPGTATKAPLEARTPLRFQYKSEVQVIRRKLGSLEEIRRNLGLSRRQMCKLLMVDPSSWTRWVKDEDRVPPHVFRALQWYLALIDKESAWHPQNRFGLVQPMLEAKDIKARLERLELGNLHALRAEAVSPEPSSRLLDERRSGGYWMAFLLIIGLAIGFGYLLGSHF